MKISTRSRYGMRAMLDLAIAYGEGPLQIKSIAKEEDISNKYLEQLISILKSAGLVRSVRGPRGGYILTRPPKDITLFDIFTVLEGPLSYVECVDDVHVCNRGDECIMKGVWCKIQTAIREILEKTTLGELANRAKSGKSGLNYCI